MQAATLAHLKNELKTMPSADLIEVCIKLIKFKKENKELVSYLLFESGNETAYILNLKNEIDELFDQVNTNSVFWAKKTIRKILRIITKHSKYSGMATTQIQMLLHFCNKLNELPLDYTNNAAMFNLYNNQLKKMDKLILTLHEDLQFDYLQRIDQLRIQA